MKKINKNMKKILIIFWGLCVFGTAFSQRFSETFDSYELNEDLTDAWIVNGNVELDTNFYSSAKNSIKISKSSEIIIPRFLNKLGKLELSLMAKGAGIWNLSVYISTSTNFGKEENWTKINEINTDLTQTTFSTRTFDINKLKKNYFIKFKFELNGENSFLYIDDIIIHKISKDAVARIREEEQQIKLKKERKNDFEKLLADESFENAEELVNNYKKTYKKRIKTLSMIYDKSNVIKVLSGTASALGDYNQLSNPMNYEKYEHLKKVLIPKLDPIDTLFYSDEIEGKLQDFFKKIENPLNIAVGIGDIFTGGSVSKVVSGFKSLITKAYSTERLTTLGVKKRNVKMEHKKGTKLYLDTKKFFEDIESQNIKTLKLNSKISDIYQDSKKLNKEIEDFFIEYMAFSSLVLTKDNIIDLSKNQTYTKFDKEINHYFKIMLGNRRNFDAKLIAKQTKEIDNYFQKIENYISEYDKLSNSMSSFFVDFNKQLSGNCPYRNITQTDIIFWKSKVSNIQKTLKDVENTFNKSYTDINFKQ